MEGRKEIRSQQRLRVLLMNGEEPLAAAFASTENVSTNGARIVTDRPWKPGSRVLLKSSLGELLADAKVVYSQALPANDFAVGLQFLVRTGGWMM